MSPLQRARIAAQLTAKLGELADARGPIARVRLAKEVTDLCALLGAQAVISMTGKELGEFPDSKEGLKALRDAAMAVFEGLLKDSPNVPCPALGADVELRTAGMKKVKSASSDRRKLKIIPGLIKLIRAAKKVGTKPNYDKANSPNILEYHTLRSLVKLGGEDLAVRFVVGHDDKGLYHYDHTIFQREVIFDGANENGRTEVNPLVLSGGIRGFTHDRSAMPEPARLLSIEPSTERQDGRILDDSRGIVKSGYVFNLFIEGEDPEDAQEEGDSPALGVLREVAAGETTSVEEENRIKPMSRAAFNRANQREQDAHEKRVKDGGKVSVYMLGESVMDKIAYDYANYRISKIKEAASTMDCAQAATDFIADQTEITNGNEAAQALKTETQGSQAPGATDPGQLDSVTIPDDELDADELIDTYLPDAVDEQVADLGETKALDAVAPVHS